MKFSTFMGKGRFLVRISRKSRLKPGAVLLRALKSPQSQQTSQAHTMEHTNASSGPCVGSMTLGRIPGNREQDITRIGATTGFEVSQLIRIGAVGSSFPPQRRSPQRSGRLVARRVLPGFSAGLRGAAIFGSFLADYPFFSTKV